MEGYSGWSLTGELGVPQEKFFFAITSEWCASPLPHRFGAPPPRFATARSSLSSMWALHSRSCSASSSPLPMTGARSTTACSASLGGTDPRYRQSASSSSSSRRSLAAARACVSTASASCSWPSRWCFPVLMAPSTSATLCCVTPSKSATRLISKSCGRSWAFTALRTMAIDNLLRSETCGSATRPLFLYINFINRSMVLFSMDFSTEYACALYAC
mmetsp:Transcript_25865/g.67582  ORF Transcript_25865/g.67582 Transcript_25865/m.67582 type:complete len:216 (+) Transcript_25865:632-1279(+)